MQSALGILLLVLFSYVHADQTICQKEFRSFQIEYNKNYTSEEYILRSKIFMENCLAIEEHNSNPNRTYDQIINFFADQDPKQVQQKLGLSKNQEPKLGSDEPPKVGEGVGASVYLPPYLDYKSKGYVTSVKDQGSCGDCWAFAATAAYESRMLLFGHNYSLSDEAALQCTNSYITNGHNNSCNGGYLNDVMTYYNLRGGVLSSKYPYVAYYASSYTPTTAGICSDSMRYKLGQGDVYYYYNKNLTNDQIKTLLVLYGPLPVGIYASSSFQSYLSGVYNGCSSYTNPSLLNHAVLLYGWDSNGNWLIKNSWGTSWGQSGYMVLASGYNCGISSMTATISFKYIYENPYIDITNEILPS